MSDSLHALLVLAALRTAVKRRNPSCALVHHSDRRRAVRMPRMPPADRSARHGAEREPGPQLLRQRDDVEPLGGAEEEAGARGIQGDREGRAERRCVSEGLVECPLRWPSGSGRWRTDAHRVSRCSRAPAFSESTRYPDTTVPSRRSFRWSARRRECANAPALTGHRDTSFEIGRRGRYSSVRYGKPDCVRMTKNERERPRARTLHGPPQRSYCRAERVSNARDLGARALWRARLRRTSKKSV